MKFVKLTTKITTCYEL